MNINMRTVAISMLSGGLLALGSSMAFAESNNIDNTSTGESGHGTGCSNHIGGCYSPQESSTFGSYQPSTEATGASMSTGTTMSTSPTVNPDNTTTGESGHGTGFYTAPRGCPAASDATPGHCISGGTNN